MFEFLRCKGISNNNDLLREREIYALSLYFLNIDSNDTKICKELLGKIQEEKLPL